MSTYEELLSEYDVELMLGSISDAVLDDIKFMGKDPKELLLALKACEANATQRMKDIALIVALVQVRGANVTKIMDRTSDKGKKHLQTVIQKYKIVAHNKSVPMKTPTLPRIASLFPEMSLAFREKHPSIVQTVGKTGIIPDAFMFPGAGAVLDDDSMPLWLEWYESFCEVVGIKYDEQTASLGHKFSREKVRHNLSGA